MAQQRQLPVLIVFSGSDWCQPCIRLEKQVLSDTSFQLFAEKNLILLRAEFPQRKKLSKEEASRNEILASKYNPAGSFPQLVLVNPDGSQFAVLAYPSTASDFIFQLKTAFKKGNYYREFRASQRLMATPFDFSLVDNNNDRGWDLIRGAIDEVKRVEGFLSEYNDTTEVSRLVALAGKHPVKVSDELYQLTRRSIEISKLTQGAYDITFAGMNHIWKFDGSMLKVPDSAALKPALKNVGYQQIQLLSGDSVFLPVREMRLGYDACGNGYGADKAKEYLVQHGVKAGLVNGSGDLTAWGKRPDGSPWKVGIADPFERGKILLWLPVEDMAVCTSGNYEKFTEIGGKRYGHILDPRTGRPAQGLRSVTIISPSAELSDALATAVFVMGKEAGLNLIEQLPQTNCILVDDEKQIFYSKNLHLNK